MAGVNAIERLTYRRSRYVSPGPRRAAFHPMLDGVHLMIGNVKTWLQGRLHGVSRKYRPAYVAEFVYRFTGQRSRPDLFGWVHRRLMTRKAVTLRTLQATADATRVGTQPVSVTGASGHASGAARCAWRSADRALQSVLGGAVRE